MRVVFRSPGVTTAMLGMSVVRRFGRRWASVTVLFAVDCMGAVMPVL